MLLAAFATASTRQHQQLLGLRCLASRAGLFGMERLRDPEDWRSLVDETKARSAACSPPTDGQKSLVM